LGTSLSQSAPRATAASKLKLVRTGGSSQTSGPNRTGPGGIGSARSEAQPVWNKNQRKSSVVERSSEDGILTRAAAPPPPKKEFTDEELSKKYGIHLASRLGADETSTKEAKWADIDDDDDDWVPMTIEWGDGMKTSIHPEEHVSAAQIVQDMKDSKEPPKQPAKQPAQESVKNTAVVVAQPAPVKPMAPPPPRETSVTGFSGPKTLITQKPSIKSMQTTTAPAAPRPSPWAKIPPPNSVPPVQINPQPVRPLETGRRDEYQQREPSAVKEVSAEHYDRSWREKGGGHVNRELFNPQTGKTEPAPDERRPGRSPATKPAVLQRPTGPSQPSGPAEPSAAFQTGRTSHRPDDFRRRRTSSNVSGGSGSVGRRVSFSRYGVEPPTPDEMGFARERPMYSNPFDEHGPSRQHGPHGMHHQPQFQSHKEISPTMSNASPVTRPNIPNGQAYTPPNLQQEAPPPTSQVPVESPEDLLAKQDRVMKEARELARKRRLEEEQKEEAARRERLKSKLDALERQAKEKEEKEAAARRAEEERVAAEKATENKRLAEEAEARELERERELKWEQREQRERNAKLAGEVVGQHHQHPTQHQIPVGPASIGTQRPFNSERPKGTRQALTDRTFADRYVRQPPFIRPTSPNPSSFHHHNNQQPPPPTLSHSQQLSSSDTSTLQYPNLSSQDPLPQDTDDMHNRSRRSPQEPQAQAQDRKPFAAMHNNGNNGNNNNRNSTWKHGSSGNHRGYHPASPWGAVGDGSRPAGDGSRYGNNPRYNNAHNTTGGYNNAHNTTGDYNNAHNTTSDYNHNNPPRPQGTFHNNRYIPYNPTISRDDRAEAVNRWNNLPSQIVADEAAARERGRQAALKRKALEDAGVKFEEPCPQYEFKETFKETRVGKDGNQRLVSKSTTELNVEGKVKDITEGNVDSSPIIKSTEENDVKDKVQDTKNIKTTDMKVSHGVPYDTKDVKTNDIKASDGIPRGPSGNRPSRFFPTSDKNIVGSKRPTSPPPPMSASHPVNGDDKITRVNLPPTKQDTAGTNAANCNWHPTSNTRNNNVKDDKRFEEVQRAILGKLEHHPSGPRALLKYAGSKSIAPRSKPSFEASPETPTVSLPSQGALAIGDESMSTIPTSEQFLNELFHQDFGSIPTVRIPHLAHNFAATATANANANANANALPSKGVAKPKPAKDMFQSVVPFNSYSPKDFVNSEGSRFVPVRIPGVTEYTEVPVRGPEKRNKAQRKKNGRGNYSNSYNRGKKVSEA
jgi:hypothetical protein